MPHYRLYFMNTCNGHIDRAEDLQARDDSEAMATAKGLVDDKPIELWCGTRKIHRFETASTVWLARIQEQRAERQNAAATNVVDLQLWSKAADGQHVFEGQGQNEATITVQNFDAATEAKTTRTDLR